MSKKRPLIFLIGKSGSGKDTAADYLCEMYGFHKVASYTTRQRRPGEENGREHTFISWGAVAHSPETWLAHRGLHLLAKTVYGGHYYFTAKEQLTHHIKYTTRDAKQSHAHADTPADEQPVLYEPRLIPFSKYSPVVYIIDEKGLMDMLADSSNLAWLNDNFNYEVWTILRESDTMDKLPSERLARDMERMELPMHMFNWVILNDGKHLGWLYEQLDSIMRQSDLLGQ